MCIKHTHIFILGQLLEIPKHKSCGSFHDTNSSTHTQILPHTQICVCVEEFVSWKLPHTHKFVCVVEFAHSLLHTHIHNKQGRS